jgi:hypothetical protein
VETGSGREVGSLTRAFAASEGLPTPDPATPARGRLSGIRSPRYNIL